MQTFAELLRQRMDEAKAADPSLSQRRIADLAGITHVYLGQILRGLRSTPSDDVIERLGRAIPTTSPEELREAVTLERPIALDLSQHPPGYRRLGLTLARRIEQRDLTDETMAALLRLLEEDPDHER